jgi:CHAD domain-containing protein
MPRDRSDLATAEAAAGALRDALAQIEKALRRILVSDDPEGPHQMRVGLRRLRTALSLFEPALGKATTRNLSDAARKLGREVGELRDLEVALHETVGPARDAAPDDPALAAIADGLTEAIGKERARLRSQLDKGRLRRFLGAVALFCDAEDWRRRATKKQRKHLDRPLRKTAERGLARRWKKVRAAGKRVEGDTTEARHELRKELKKLRYGVEALSIALPRRRTAAFLDTLADLQRHFGDLNDAATVTTVLGSDFTARLGDDAAREAARRLARRASDRAEESWPDALELWTAFRRQPRPWT